MKNLSITSQAKLFAILVTMLAALIISFFSAFYLFYHNDISNHFISNAQKFKQGYQQHLQLDSKLMNGMIYHLKRDLKLQQIWLSKNRNHLYDYTKPIFKKLLVDFNITHFYFIDLNKKCFLRVHNPKKFGDQIPRKTLKISSEQNKISSGVELGTFATLALRTVHPWEINGKLVGYIELGEEIDYIPPQLLKVSDINSIFLINKKLINRTKWQEGQRMLGNKINWKRFADYVTISNTVDIFDLELKKTSHPTQAQYNGQNYYQKDISLKDIAGNNIGKIVLVQNITKELNSFKTSSYLIIISFSILGGFLFYIFFVITNRVEKEKTSMQKQIFLSSKLASVGELAAGVGHEINNPLAILTGHIALIKKELTKTNYDSTKLRKSLQIQEESVFRIANIVNGLRSYARIDTDNQHSIDIHLEINNTVNLIEAMYRKDMTTINTNLDATNYLFDGNIGKFQQVLMNLLSNAKYSMKDNDIREIVIQTKNIGNIVSIDITDTGVGISEEIKNKVFDTFFTTKEVGQGTGMGLGISLAITQEFNGNINVHSQTGKGSTFSICLPFLENDISQNKKTA